ncbi:MAG TPA: aquaporin [Gammaproteobacteria bacterium]|jgi:glycerol uptake facilitator-like aquaporin
MRLSDVLFAEFLGTLLLLLITVGSDAAAAQASGGNEYLTLAANALATGFGISALILALNPVSGACFNPLAAVLLCVDGDIRWQHLPGYLLVQFGGALLGIALVHYLFGLPVLELADKPRPGLALACSEFIGSIGLLLVIHRVGYTRSQWVAYAVGAYLLAATWALPSNCLANPALTVARMFTGTFAGVRPQDAAGFLLAQCLALGAMVGFLLCRKRFSMLGD